MFLPHPLFIADSGEIDVFIFLEEEGDEFLELWIVFVIHGDIVEKNYF